MKLNLSFYTLATLLFFGCSIFAQTDNSCEVLLKRSDSLLILARDFAKQKQFITSDSYFKVAEENYLNNENCFPLGTTKFKEEHLVVIPAATYQKLIEKVIELQDQNEFMQAMDMYTKAGIYFSSYNLSSLELTHLTLKDFVFSKGKGGFAKYLCEYYFDNKKYKEALEIYKGLLDRKLDPEDIKRPLYDLGVQMAIEEKKKQSNANPNELAETITSSRADLTYFRKGFLFSWKSY
jgi:tetratricopeptide (TPR) repeat protein